MELKFTFKEGGAPDFQVKFETIKERLQQVVETARANNERQSNVDVSNVHLDELPSYQDSGHDRIPSPDRSTQTSPVPTNANSDQVRAMAAAASIQRQQESQRRRSRELEEAEQQTRETPDDAPPGYEEAQQQSVEAQMEWRDELRR